MCIHGPCVQTGSRLPGTVWRGLIFFTTDRPDYHRMPPPAGDTHGWVIFAVRTGFALGHHASTFHACAHLITTAVRYQLRAQGRYFVPEPNMVGGVTGRSPGERPQDGIAGGSPATFPAKRNPRLNGVTESKLCDNREALETPDCEPCGCIKRLQATFNLAYSSDQQSV